MTTPFYVSPEQLMRDRADYVRKGISRSLSVVVLNYDGGILFVAQNRSRVLHKISELYDRIGFAAAGRYDEFERLRQAGVRLADTRGYLYDRRDVAALGLANAYAQTLGSIFSEQGGKPYEVELVIAQVGDRADQDQIYRITYDGSVTDEHGFVVMGGNASTVSSALESTYHEGAPLAETLRAAMDALGRDNGEQHPVAPAMLEVAVLDRSRKQDRKFRRLVGSALTRLLEDGAAPEEASADAEADAEAEDGAAEAGGRPETDDDADGSGQTDLLADIDEVLGEDEGGAGGAGGDEDRDSD